ncbi:hypothetical protein CI238_09704, partial [Colletotrichum incanum]
LPAPKTAPTPAASSPSLSTCPGTTRSRPPWSSSLPASTTPTSQTTPPATSAWACSSLRTGSPPLSSPPSSRPSAASSPSPSPTTPSRPASLTSTRTTVPSSKSRLSSTSPATQKALPISPSPSPPPPPLPAPNESPTRVYRQCFSRKEVDCVAADLGIMDEAMIPQNTPRTWVEQFEQEYTGIQSRTKAFQSLTMASITGVKVRRQRWDLGIVQAS